MQLNGYEIDIEDLPPEYRDLADDIGLDSALRLVEARGGEGLYVPTADKICRAARDRAIRADREAGMSLRDIKRKYGLTMVWIRRILGERHTQTGVDVVDKQLTLF